MNRASSSPHSSPAPCFAATSALKRLHRGEWIAGVAAIALLVLMFFDWFGSKDSGELRLFSVGHSAWEALGYVSVILAIAIAVTLGVVALRLLRAAAEPSIAMNATVAILGLISALLILIRILDPPDFGSFREAWGTVTIEGTVQPPMFLALLAAAGIAVGGFWATRAAMCHEMDANNSTAP